MSALQEEITNDPLARGYSGFTDQQLVDSLNTVNRTRNRATMTASEVANQIDVAEFNALLAADKQEIWDVVHIVGGLNPFGVEATIFQNVFGGGSATIANLQAARVENISRGVEIGAGFITLKKINQEILR